MKQFNTFAANSIALSDYYSPKNSPQGGAFGNSKYDKDPRPKPPSLLTDNYFKSPNFNENPHRQKSQQQTPHQQFHQKHIQDIPQDLSQRSEDNFDTHLSLLMSNVSLPQLNTIEINQQKLFNLQNTITQHLLQLREQKIILMQELSKIIDNKNLFEYYLLKSNLQKQDTETNMDSPIRYDLQQIGQQEQYIPINISAPLLKDNEQLHLKLKQLQIKQEIFGSTIHEEQNSQQNQQLITQIIHTRQLISNLQKQLSIKHKITKNDNQQSRFITFLPQDRQKHFQSTVKSNLEEQYRTLQQKFNQLKNANQHHKYKLTLQEARYLEDLKKENRRLIEEVQNMIKDKRGQQPQRIVQLKRIIDENQKQKQVFLQQLQKFKEVMYNAKNQNKRLKFQLNI